MGYGEVPGRYVLAGVAITVGVASALFVIADSQVEILVYAVLFGFGVGGLLSVPPVGYADYYGRRSLGVIRGVTEPLTTIGQAIGAVVAGVIFDLTESYQLAFIAFAVMGGTGDGAGAVCRPPRRQIRRRGNHRTLVKPTWHARSRHEPGKALPPALTVHWLEEAVQEVAIVGQEWGAAQNGSGNGLSLLVGYAEGLVVAQFGRNVGGEDDFALARFKKQLERIKPLGAPVGGLVDEQLVDPISSSR